MFVFTVITTHRTIKYGVTNRCWGCCHKQTRCPPSRVPALPGADSMSRSAVSRIAVSRSAASPQRSFPAAGTLSSHSRKAPAGSMSSPGQSEAAEQTLLVGNLESRVREEILYELFLQVADRFPYIAKCCSNAREEKNPPMGCWVRRAGQHAL